jgi:CTP:molybdopterin cytidylyltransferase MocA
MNPLPAMITAIVLAAGASSRMGRNKMLLPFGNSTVVESAIDVLKRPGIDKTIVVLGFGREAIEPVLLRHKVELVVNPDPERGMLSSIQHALASEAAQPDGWLIALGDQPQIQPEVVDSLVQAFIRNPQSIVVPVCEVKRGHPIIVSSRFRNEILELPETVGLNELTRRHADEILEVTVRQPGILKDIDTPEDYRELLAGPA